VASLAYKLRLALAENESPQKKTKADREIRKGNKDSCFSGPFISSTNPAIDNCRLQLF
jgi:hypothetical protein